MPLGHAAGCDRDRITAARLLASRCAPGRRSCQPPEGALRADDGIRTRDPHLGKVMRYQLRYVRATSALPHCPPADDSIRWYLGHQTSRATQTSRLQTV
jgi:hypothetical protein